MEHGAGQAAALPAAACTARKPTMVAAQTATERATAARLRQNATLVCLLTVCSSQWLAACRRWSSRLRSLSCQVRHGYDGCGCRQQHRAAVTTLSTCCALCLSERTLETPCMTPCQPAAETMRVPASVRGRRSISSSAQRAAHVCYLENFPIIC